MESKKKYRELIENEERLRIDEGNQRQEVERLKEWQESISEQERTILDLKNQINQLKKTKKVRNLFLASGMLVVVILANVILSFFYNNMLEHGVVGYQIEMQNKLSEMEKQLQ